MGEKGRFIVFEGIDGSGKSTQLKLLSERLSASGIECVETLEPTFGRIGRPLHDILSGKLEADPRVCAAMFAADRLDHVLNPECGVLKSLSEGKWVLCDRYYFSSYAYQSVEVPQEWVVAANSLCADALRPDITIFIDVSPETAMERINKNRGETEIYENLERLTAVRRAYFDAFERMKETEKIAVFDGNRDVSELADEIEDFVRNSIFFTKR